MDTDSVTHTTESASNFRSSNNKLNQILKPKEWYIHELNYTYTYTCTYTCTCTHTCCTSTCHVHICCDIYMSYTHTCTCTCTCTNTCCTVYMYTYAVHVHVM